MQKLRFIKGQSYFIDGHPYSYQGRENGIYRFLRKDGNQKYLYENNLDKVKPTPLNEESEQKLKATEEENTYSKEKEEAQQLQEKYVAEKKVSWFSDSRFVQISTGLTMATIIIVTFKVSIEAGRNSGNFGVGLLTFAGLLIGGLLISWLVAWLAYKAEGFVDEERNSDLIIKLLFFLPVIWFLLYKLFQVLFLHKADSEG